MTRHTTLLGRVLELDRPPKLAIFYAKILDCDSGAAAEALAYGDKNPIPHALDAATGLPIWTVEQLTDPRWAYLQDAVARCRLAAGELDLESVMRAATWEVAEAARSLGVSTASVRQNVESGALPAVQVAGRWMLDRRAVEAFAGAGARGGPRPASVPALYARAGNRGEASLVVIAVDAAGAPVDGELTRDVDGVEELVIADWAEALIAAGVAGKLRAWRVRPAHGRPVSRFGVAGLEAVGRFEILDKTNNRGEAVHMLETFKLEKGVRRG